MIALLVLLLHCAVTWYMTGVIWLVQWVHYPLFNRVDTDKFRQFIRDHANWITWVVLPPMLIELSTALALLWLQPPGIPFWMLLTGAFLVVLIWISTFAIQVPQHNRLQQGFDPAAYTRLVQSNWLRTVAWSVRACLVTGILYSLLHHPLNG